MSDPAILILAAGSSSRMGQPKQLLRINGKSLIRRITERALAISNQIFLVLGAAIDKIRPELDGLNISILENKDWSKGMGTSLRCGLHFIQKNHPEVNSVLILLCDQPHVTSAYLQTLIKTHQENKQVATASAYNDILGAPAIVELTIFKSIITQSENIGARQLLKALDENGAVNKVSFPEGAIDLDRWEDYERFITD